MAPVQLAVELTSYARILEQTELVQEYAAECSLPEIGQVTPDLAMYTAMERAGMCQAFMAYQDEMPVGFAGLLFPVMPHYSRRVATVETVFITESARKTGIGRELMRTVEEFARNAECEAILWSAPAGGKLERVLSASKRYRHSNTVFVRSLG